MISRRFGWSKTIEHPLFPNLDSYALQHFDATKETIALPMKRIDARKLISR